MSARVLLMRLSCRTSARGVDYLSGYLGAARVVAFKAKEPDKYGNEQWEVFVAEPQPKGDQRDQRTRGQLPVVGETREHRNETRDPRQERIDELARRFAERPPDEVPW